MDVFLVDVTYTVAPALDADYDTCVRDVYAVWHTSPYALVSIADGRYDTCVGDIGSAWHEGMIDHRPLEIAPTKALITVHAVALARCEEIARFAVCGTVDRAYRALYERYGHTVDLCTRSVQSWIHTR